MLNSIPIFAAVTVVCCSYFEEIHCFLNTHICCTLKRNRFAFAGKVFELACNLLIDLNFTLYLLPMTE